MSLQELGNIGELVGGLAVLASLVYLALQIRQNTTSVRAATSASISESLSHFTELLSSQPELARIWVKARAEYDSLNEHERQSFLFAVNTYMRRLENAFYQRARGFVDPDHRDIQPGVLADEARRIGLAVVQGHPDLGGVRDDVDLALRYSQRWKDAASSMVDKWVADMKAKGIDGAMLVKDAQALVKKHSQ